MGNATDHYQVCKTCLNIKINPQTGFFCGLTNEKPDFLNICDSYQLDQVKAEIDETRQKSHGNAFTRLIKDYPKISRFYLWSYLLIFTIISYFTISHAEDEFLLFTPFLEGLVFIGFTFWIYGAVRSNQKTYFEPMNVAHYGIGLIVFSVLINAVALVVLILVGYKDMLSQLFFSYILTKAVFLLLLYGTIRAMKRLSWWKKVLNE